MSKAWEENEYLERRQRERAYRRREEEAEAYEARTALEMAFEERIGCVEACFDTCVHQPECLAAGIAEPVAIALGGWLRSQRIAATERRAA